MKEIEQTIALINLLAYPVILSLSALTAIITILLQLRRHLNRRRQKAHNAGIWAEVVADAAAYRKKFPFTNRDTTGSRHLAGAKRWDELERKGRS